MKARPRGVRKAPAPKAPLCPACSVRGVPHPTQRQWLCNGSGCRVVCFMERPLPGVAS